MEGEGSGDSGDLVAGIDPEDDFRTEDESNGLET